MAGNIGALEPHVYGLDQPQFPRHPGDRFTATHTLDRQFLELGGILLPRYLEHLLPPLASILSFAMALKYSFSREEDADILEKAISNVLDAGLRTKDIATKGSKVISTVEMGDAVISSLNDLS